jgi:fructose-1,6-bisphosphatase/inositol monophosphatase family enzyme
MAAEMGHIVTTLDGSPPPPLHRCQDYQRPGLLIAANPEIHHDLVEAVRQSDHPINP